MKKINIFLASSKELHKERLFLEMEINRKNKSWYQKELFLHLDICEDLSTRLSYNGSQNEYNSIIKKADIFILIACSKIGIYTNEEFDIAYESFKTTNKPIIFTYLNEEYNIKDKTMKEFKDKLKKLKHYPAAYYNCSDLWNKFNKEIDRLYSNNYGNNDLNIKIKNNFSGCDIYNSFFE